ncbi:acetyltransferase [Candidatus Pelagibacter sp. HIMB1506]|uniref:acetyltransferase n=1 Tax=Candidatus Pelagibacter sp. HIMB1506 TaxID=3413337 RepID=UPI003F868058
MEKRKILIFGNGPSAEVVYRILKKIKRYEFTGFTVDKKYIKKKKIFGYPVFDFKYFLKKFPKKKYDIFISVGYSNMNSNRETIYNKLKKLGYNCPNIFDPSANIPEDLIIGDNNFIMNDVHIHPIVKMGNNNFIWSGSIISHHVKVGNHCWFTSGSSVAGNTKIGNNCFFGLNSSIINNIKIGNKCFIGARSLVSKNLKNKSVVISPPSTKHKLNSEQFTVLIDNKF